MDVFFSSRRGLLQSVPVLHYYWTTFLGLIKTPFANPELIWGVVPLYFGWVLNELTSDKASFRTAIQTGFSLLWGGAQWTYLYFHRATGAPTITLNALLAVNVAVTIAVLAIGLVAFISGLRRRYPKYCSFLGHARFSSYFMITIFPMQSNYLPWTWDRIRAIAIFAIPIWLLLHFGLKPLRR